MLVDPVKRALFLLLLTMMACSEQKTAREPTPVIAEAWQARCGNCHTRIAPHSRTGAALEAAFARHKSRTRMTPEEWKQLKDFLASDGPAGRQDGTASIARR